MLTALLGISGILALLIILFLLLVAVYFYFRKEGFNVPKDPRSEYVPPNMGVGEWRQINKWDYPGYMNWSGNLSGNNKEKFDNIYPGGRGDVNCVDADWPGAGGQCDPEGPYMHSF